jgi:hypothetical protein
MLGCGKGFLEIHDRVSSRVKGLFYNETQRIDKRSAYSKIFSLICQK